MAAAAEVAAVAPGQRGWDTRAMRPPGRKQPAEFAQPGGRVGPHADCVDGKRGVEWPVADRQALDRRANQAYPSGPYGGPIAAAGLADHYLRVVDADHQSPDRSGGEGGDGHARTAAEFDDAVGRLDVEKLHRPAVARHVRRASAHDPAGGVPHGSGRVVELCQPAVSSPPLHDAAQRPVLDAHHRSRALRVRLKSMPATERTVASSVTPTLLSIGELSERTGVPTTALRYYDELGLVRPAARAAGRRRYAASAVRDVGVIRFLREIGFSLAEIGRFIAGERQSQRDMIDHKLAELAEQQHRIEVARTALEHDRQCPASEPMKCSRFWSIIEPTARPVTGRKPRASALTGLPPM